MNPTEDYVKRMLKVLIYIENHIENELAMDELAKVACQSPFHFHRIFQAIVGETAHKYVRRLRLEKAAGRLLYTEQPITEIALDANYDTPSAFTRAFKQCMGESPKNYRALYKEVKKMAKTINELPIIYPEKIEIISDLSVLFIRRFGNYVTSSKDAWDAMQAFIHKEHLNKAKLRFISISHDDPQITNEDRLRFDACIQTFSGITEEGEIGRQVIKGGKCVIFVHRGPHEYLTNTFNQIFLKWFPNNKEHFDDTRLMFCEHFNLEYVDKDKSKLVTHIYIPIS